MPSLVIEYHVPTILCMHKEIKNINQNNNDYCCMFQRTLSDERRATLDAGGGGPAGPHSRRIPPLRPQARRQTSAGAPAGGGLARHTHGNTSPIYLSSHSGTVPQ